MQVNEIDIPMQWGSLRAQIFGKQSLNSKPIIALHGYLDNSNSIRPLAEYLTSTNEYFIISLDLPGHGFSSHLTTGIYTPKIFILCLRRLIKYFNFKTVTLLAHSYGCSIILLYSMIFKNEVDACILIDFTLSGSEKKSIIDAWKYGIDEIIKSQYDTKNNQIRNGELTKEIALNRLLEVNKSLDKKTAEIIIERGIIEKNGKIEFTRDIKAKQQMLSGDHYTENLILLQEFEKNSNYPILYLHSEPFFASKKGLEFTKSYLSKSNGYFESIAVNGNHFFHMLQPEKTGKIIETFLKKHSKNNLINDNPVSKL